jgi:16S rRNA (guanine527-N7)-methyltransferase
VKHVEAADPAVERVLEWLNVSISNEQTAKFFALAQWLVVEAIPGGGLGPYEGSRIWARHVADSLAFAHPWVTEPPTRMVDIGSGVGLPGIALAVLWPGTEVTLFDRSQRRVDLARRACRVIGTSNVRVHHGEIEKADQTWPAATLRAVAAPEKAIQLADRVLNSAGTAVIGLRGPIDELPPDTPNRTFSMVAIPTTVLDGSVSLLMMGPREH